MNGLDLFLIAFVIAGAFLLVLHRARQFDEIEEERNRQFFEALELQHREQRPFDWAIELLDEIERLPERGERVAG